MHIYVVRLGFLYFQRYHEESEGILFTPNLKDAHWMNKSTAEKVQRDVGGEIYSLEISLAKYDKADNESIKKVAEFVQKEIIK